MDLEGATPSGIREILGKARTLLRGGGLVVYPTDTAYGLGAYARRPEAVRSVFRAKNRSFEKPVSVCVSSFDEIEKLAVVCDPVGEVIRSILPGPYTLILTSRNITPGISPSGKIGVRIPDHPIALALCDGLPLTATSANLAGRPSPRSVSEVTVAADLVLDGGPTRIAEDSTILDLSSAPSRVVRRGAGSIPEVSEALERSGLRLE